MDCYEKEFILNEMKKLFFQNNNFFCHGNAKSNFNYNFFFQEKKDFHDSLEDEIFFKLYEKNQLTMNEEEPSQLNIILKEDLNILLIHKSIKLKLSLYFHKSRDPEIMNIWNVYCDQNRKFIMTFYEHEKISKKEVLEYIGNIKPFFDDIVINSNQEKLDECFNCSSRKESIENENNGDFYCPDCFIVHKKPIEHETMTYESVSKEYLDDVKNNSFLKKTFQTDLINFSKRIDCFEGKQKNLPPFTIKEIIMTYLDEHRDVYMKGKTCEFIRGLKTNQEKREFISLKAIEKAIKNTQNSHYYKDIEIIAHWVIGWNLVDLTEYRKTIIKDYMRIQKVYQKYKERESSLNINIRLFFHLKMLKIPDIEITDFKLISSKDSIDYHKKIFKKIIEELNLDIDINFF